MRPLPVGVDVANDDAGEAPGIRAILYPKSGDA